MRLRKSRNLPKLLRLLSFAFALQLVSGLWLVYRARAGALEGLEGVGDDALRYARSLDAQVPVTLAVNGMTFQLSVSSTHDTPATVVAHYREICRARAPLVADAVVPPVPLTASRWDLSLQGGGDSRRFLACLDPGASSRSPQQWLARLHAFLRSLDLSELGQVLYVVAERHGTVTTTVLLHSQGPLRAGEAFPVVGDAPGRDLPGIPRPAGARRLLSAFQQGARPSFCVYGSDRQAAPRLLQSYRAQLTAAGFAVQPRRVGSARRSEPVYVATRGELSLLLTSRSDAQGRGLLTLIPLL